MTHEPTPWSVRKKNGSFLIADDWEVNNERHGCIAWVPIKRKNTVIALVVAAGRYDEIQDLPASNADHIVHCVNAWDDAAALRARIAELEST